MQFIIQQHSLDGLFNTMKNTLRKAACRTHALQALNWLLRNVSQTVSLHDLMWCFVASLTPTHSSEFLKEESEDNANFNSNHKVPCAVSGISVDGNYSAQLQKEENDYPNQNQFGICQHPLSDLAIIGEGTYSLTQAFHTFLQTVSDLMPLLPMGSALQQIGVRCFCLQFLTADHTFLHECHVFSNISKIFARTDEENINVIDDNQPHHAHQLTIETYQDLTSQMEIKTSSRQAMIASLTDNSTETFWESGDEDRNKTKYVTITCNSSDNIIKYVYVHIDNCRDLGCKVSQIVFKCGDTASYEQQMNKLKVVDVENRFAGWILCVLPQGDVSPKVIKMDIKGPDNTLRLRQIKVIGYNKTKIQDICKAIFNSQQIQQVNCEAETLRVFRLLTSQVSLFD